MLGRAQAQVQVQAWTRCCSRRRCQVAADGWNSRNACCSCPPLKRDQVLSDHSGSSSSLNPPLRPQS
ncbi:hypothetical protein INR49_011538 [Caranx melampygus]|nr:hypothetical protein INR49_011538 [Caranx melampygus]